MNAAQYTLPLHYPAFVMSNAFEVMQSAVALPCQVSMYILYSRYQICFLVWADTAFLHRHKQAATI